MEVTATELWRVFERAYLRADVDAGIAITSYDTAETDGDSRTRITLRIDGREHTTTHRGGGPVEALTAALDAQSIRIDVVSLHQTSVGSGADSEALTLLEHRTADGGAWSAGRDRSVLSSTLSAVIAAATASGRTRRPDASRRAQCTRALRTTNTSPKDAVPSAPRMRVRKGCPDGGRPRSRGRRG